MNQQELTILICTHNRQELLVRTLNFLNDARRPEHWYLDILVAMNACSDGTRERLRQYIEETDNSLPINAIEEPEPGKSLALNHALTLIRGEFVAFVDDDHRVDSNYLIAICEAAEKYSDADFFCGRILPDWNGNEPAWVHDTGPYRIYPLPVPRFDQGEDTKILTPDIAVPGGGNLIIRTQLFERVGCFSHELGPTGHNLEGSEDLDWVLRAQRLGAQLHYIPSIIQYHYVDIERLRTRYLIRKAYKRTASSARLLSDSSKGNVPLYLYRKLAENLMYLLFSFDKTRRRFYSVRIAATLGEIKGHRLRPHGDGL